MVAVVSGAGLGLFGSSISALGGAGTSGNAGIGRGTDRVFVNTVTGNLVIQSQDELLRALGLDVSLVRTYNAQGLMNDDNGDNWRLGVHQRIHSLTGTVNAAGSTVVKTFGDGREVLYSFDGARYVSSEGEGAHDTLTFASSQWTWTEGASRSTETYNSDGRLLSSRDADGNEVSYTYNAGGLLTAITDASGQATYLDYTGTNLTQIRAVSNGQTQTLTRYSYDASNRLSQVIVDLTPQDNSVVDSAVYTTTYTYDGTSRRIQRIEQADGSAVNFTYEQLSGQYRVRTYTDAEGRTVTLTYSNPSATGGGGGPASVAANTSVLSTTDTQSYPLNSSLLTTPSGWSAAALLESSGTAGNEPKLAFDASGNGFAVWAQGSDVVLRRYTAATNTWAAAEIVDSGAATVYAPVLAVDGAGNAIVAWVQSDGTSNSVYARHYSVTAGTWNTATVLESWPEAVLTSPGSVSVSVNGGLAAVAWVQSDGTNEDLYASILDAGNWYGPSLVDAANGAVSRRAIAIDLSINATVIWQQSDGTAESIYASRYSNTTFAWGTPTLLESSATAASEPRLLFDGSGNGIALWAQGNDLIARRYTAATDTWSSAVVLDTGSSAVSTPSLSIDAASGNAIVAWVQSDGTAASVYVSRYTASSDTWSTAVLLESTSQVVSSDALMTSMSGGYAAVAWLQSNGTDNDLYAARWDGSAWSGSQLIETSSNAASQPAIAIDASGNAIVVWQQSDGTASSIYQARYLGTGGVPYYTIPSGASWQSLANTLYGVNSAAAGSALQAAMSNAPLTAGTQLTGLPATLVVTTTVPAYYTVQTGDTWSSITQAVYGTSDVNAISALQAALSNPTLSVGLRLTVPLTLGYSTGSGGGATLYQQTDVQDALGNVTTYVKDAQGRLTSVLSPTVNGARLETRYAYDTDGNVTSINEDPTGLNRLTTFSYDTNGNLLTTRDSAGNTIRRTYNSDNQLLTETRYLVPDPDGAGPGEPSVPLTTRYVYDSQSHLRFVISPEGRVTEHQYSSNVGSDGLRIATLRYTAGQYTPTVFTESDLVTWAAAQDLTQLERVDYSYDFRGNISTLTRSATTNASGAGTGTASLTQFVYDQRGQLLQTIDARGSAVTPNPATANLPYATTYTYDGLGRVLSTTQWNSSSGLSTTLNAYDDGNRQTTTTLANGLITTRTYNRAGGLISVVEGSAGALSALGTTRYAYDAGGRLRIATDPSGVRQFYLYDEVGRKVAQVDGDGTLTEFIYDQASELIKTVQYAVRLDGTTLTSLVDGSGNPTTVSLSTLRTAASGAPAQDRITRQVYDAAGQRIYVIDEAGAVTQYFHDGAGRITDEVRYANPVTIARSVDQVLDGSFTLSSSADDRRTRHFYDADGQLSGTLDAAGYLLEYVYDPAGRLTQQIGYANQTGSTYWLTGTLAQLRDSAGTDAETALDPERDIRSYFFYDGQGRRIGVLDAEGYLTETVYDVAGQVVQTARYDRVLTYTAGTSTFETLRAAATATPAVTVHTTSYQYDGAGRLVLQTNYEGTETEYVYDNVGNVIGTTRARGTTEARTTEMRYDFLGRVTQELSAEGRAQITTGMSQTQINEIWNRYGITYAYDIAGRRVSATQRPNDSQTNTTLYYYDEDNRLRFEVNALGERKEYRYDALNQLTGEIRYANPIATTGLTGGLLSVELIGTLSASADPTRDATTSYAYTLTGRVLSTTTAEGVSNSYSYNAFGERTGRVEQVDATRSLTSAYTYDRRGMLTLTRWDAAALNTTEARQYDAFGRLTHLTDARNNTSRIEYDRLGQVIATVDALGGRTVTTYDAFSRTLTMRDALNNTTSYAYSNVDRSVVVTTPEGIAVTTRHTRHGQTLSVAAAGNTTTYLYDANGQLTGASDSLGALESRAYDRAGRQITATDARGVVTSFSYDAANRVLTRIQDDVGGGLALTTMYAYDALGRVATVTDPNNTLTRTSYDRDGRVTEVAVDPNGLNLRTAYTYDLQGHVITVTEGVGSTNPRLSQYTYDALGRRVLEVIDPGVGRLNLTTSYEYDSAGNLVRKVDAEGNATRYVYDAMNRARFVMDALNGITETMYDAEGRVRGTRRYAVAVSTAGLPEQGELTIAEIEARLQPNPLDRRQLFVHDRDGRQVFAIDAMGGVTRNEYDADGNMVRERAYSERIPSADYSTPQAVLDALVLASDNNRANDRERQLVYDARGRLAFEVNGLGGVVRTLYDAAGNVTARVEYAALMPDQGIPSLAAMTSWANANADAARDRTSQSWYDAAGREAFKLDAEGSLLEYRYDEVGRVTDRIAYATAPVVPVNATLAQVRGAIATNPLSDQRTITGYDAAGRVLNVTDAEGAIESYTYDAVGNRLTLTNARQAEWTYVYDANRRLIEERSPQVSVTSVGVDGSGLVPTTSTAVLVTRMTYDALGNLTSRTEAYGRPEARTTTYEYDELGRQVRTRLPSVAVYDAASDSATAFGAAVVRTETVVTPFSEVTYDALGNAIMNRDVAGNYSHKVYDELGRVRYEVDAERYVTEYRFDTFGNKTDIIRYAQRLNDTGITPSTLLSASTVSGRVSPSSNQDRRLQNEYDRLNRVITVVQPLVFNFLPNAASPGGQALMAAATTRNEYDAFGQILRQRRLVDPATNSYADTYYYYDRRGLRTAQVDALGYLSTFEYDELGRLERQVEYARALAAGWNTQSFGTAVTTTAANSPDNAAGYDRRTEFGYDRMNRKAIEIRLDVEYSQISGSNVTRTVGNQTTTFGYDALGNQTRVTTEGVGTTFQYYDVLGRLTAIADPARNRGDGLSLIPLAEMRYDAFGGMVAETRYANGATAVSDTSYVRGATSAADRVTRLQLNSHGRAVRTQDATGAQRYASYNERGDVAKEWQPVVDNDSRLDALVAIYSYDRLGRQILVTEPQTLPTGAGDTTPTLVVATRAVYNAFGEIVQKGSNGLLQEYFDYDQTGRLWRTNTGDGIDKVYLHDLLGNATAEIRSQQLNLKTSYGQASVVAELTTQRMRTETRYDLLGRIVEQRLPAFTGDRLMQPIEPTFQIGTILAPNNPSAVYRRVLIDGRTTYVVNPQATVEQDGGFFFNGTTYVQDPNYALVSARYVHWKAPVGMGITPRLEYRLSGNPAAPWTQGDVVSLPNGRLGVNVDYLAAGSYEYRVSYTRAGETGPYAEASGNFEITGTPTVTPILTPTLLDDAGWIAPLVNRPGGSIFAGVVQSAQPNDYSNWQVFYSGFNEAVVSFPQIRGKVRVELDYQTVPVVENQLIYPSTVKTVSMQIDDASTAPGGLRLMWREPSGIRSAGGIRGIDNVRVYTIDEAEQATLAYSTDGGVRSSSVAWRAPRDESVVPLFRARLSGDTNWTEVPVTRRGNEFTISTAQFDNGRWEYELTYTRGGSLTASVAGTMEIYGGQYVALENALTPSERLAVGPLQVGDTGSVGFTIAGSAVLVETGVPWLLVGNSYSDYFPVPTEWTGPNEINVTWPDLTTPTGTPRVRVDLEYTGADRKGFNYRPERGTGSTTGDLVGWTQVAGRVPGLAQSRSFEFSNAATNATLSWTDPITGREGGIGSVDRIRVYVEDSNGNWVLRYERDGATPKPGRSLYWRAPDYVAGAVLARVRIAGSSGQWQTRAVFQGTDYLYVDLDGLADGQYEYEIENTSQPAPGVLATDGIASGVLQIGPNSSGPDVRVASQTNLVFPEGRGAFDVSASGTQLSWNLTPTSGSSIVVRYRIEGEVVWREQAVNYAPGQNPSADLPANSSGSIEYEILYIGSGQTAPYASSRGTLVRNYPVTTVESRMSLTQTVTFSSGVRPIEGVVSDGDVINWSQRADPGASVFFRYRLPGGGWAPLSVTTTSAGYSVDPRALPLDTYEYEISYVRSGETEPYALALGTMRLRSATRGGAPTIASTTSVSSQTSSFAPVLRQSMDRWGNVISSTDALSNVTDYRYDRLNQLLDTRHPETDATDTRGLIETGRGRPITQNHYDIQGRLIAVRDGNGNVNSLQYNAAGQLLREVHADTGERSFRYDIFGNQILITNELGYRTRRVYDAANRLVETTSEVSAGGLDSQVAGSIVRDSYAYDEAGRRIRETNGEEETTRYFYDLRGNLVRRRSARGFETTYAHNAQGDLTRETDANGNSKRWTVDYFGVVSQQVDLGGATTTFSRNRAGLVTGQSNSLGQSISFTYDQAGHLTVTTQINNPNSQAVAQGLVGIRRITEYGYDAAGRRVREFTSGDGGTHQDTRIDYDELGRIQTLSDLRYQLTYEYDAASNRTRVRATYRDHENQEQVQDLWYAYDAMNRVRISQGNTVADFVRADVGEGTLLSYDLAGRRVQAMINGQRYEYGPIQVGVVLQTGQPIYVDGWRFVPGRSTEAYTYDGLGRLLSTTKDTIETDVRRYDGASRETRQTTRSFDSRGEQVLHVTDSTYDDDGRIFSQQTTRNGQTESIVNYGDSTLVNGTWTQGFDAAGVLRGYSVDAYSGGSYRYRTTYNLQYRLGETYQERRQDASSSGSGAPRSGSTTRTYNVNGELVGFADSQRAANNRYFFNAASGQPLTVVQGGYGDVGSARVAQAFSDAIQRHDNLVKAQHFFFANGQAIGSFGQLQGDQGEFSANFDVNYTPVSERYPAAVPHQVVAQTGDTLRVIAARLYGDATLWYLIAEENGLAEPDAEIDAGTLLRVPSEVVTLANTASSFKPFDAMQALGDTTPTQPSPPQRKGCGVLGQVLVIAIAFVATVFTAGVLTAGATASLGSIMGTGVSALGGGSWAAVGAAAAGGAVGSAAAQGMAIGLGMQEEFDWKGVAMGSIGAGVTAGLGGWDTWNRIIGSADEAFRGAGGVLNAAANTALTQGLGVLAGLQEQFSWRNVALAAVAAPGAAYAGGQVEAITGDRGFAFRLGSGIGGSLVRSAVGGKIDMTSILVDAFGNAIGNSIVDGMTPALSSSSGGRGGGRFDADIEAGIAGTRARNEAELLGMAAPTLDVNPEDNVRNPAFTLTADERRTQVARTYALGDPNAPAASPLQVTTTFANGGNGYYSADAERQALEAVRRGELSYADLGILTTSASPPSLDASLAGVQDFLSSRIQESQDVGFEQYQQGNYLSAAGIAFLVSAERIGVNTANGLIGMARLATSSDMRANLFDSVTHPLDTASRIANTIATNSWDENLLMGTEFVGFGGANVLRTGVGAGLNGVSRVGTYVGENLFTGPVGLRAQIGAVGDLSKLRPNAGIEGIALQEGEAAAAGMHAHHIFPQAGEFAAQWKSAGVNIEEFRVQLSEGSHLGQLHSSAGIPGVGPGGLWNETWRQYFVAEAAAGRAIAREGVFSQAQKMLRDFEVPYYSPIR